MAEIITAKEAGKNWQRWLQKRIMQTRTGIYSKCEVFTRAIGE